MFDVGTPQSALDHCRALRQLCHEGAALLQSLTLPVFFAPQGGAWSPAEHIRHLSKVTGTIAIGYWLPAWWLATAFGSRTGPSRTYPVIRAEYRLVLVRNPSAGVFAPRRQSPPADPDRRRADILRTWERTVSRFGRALGRWPEARLDRCQVPHPRLGPLTLREMASFVVYHTAHHLERVAERAHAATGSDRG